MSHILSNKGDKFVFMDVFFVPILHPLSVTWLTLENLHIILAYNFREANLRNEENKTQEGETVRGRKKRSETMFNGLSFSL